MSEVTIESVLQEQRLFAPPATLAAQARIGSSLVGAVAEDPSKAGGLLLYFLLPETLVIFGFLALFLI